MGILDVFKRVLPKKGVRYDTVEYPELEGLSEHRAKHESYTDWLTGQYAAEMNRRFEYYSVNQVVQNAAILRGKNYIRPRDWKAAHSGSGWDDIRYMLPDATENTIVKPMVTNFTQVVVDNTGVVYAVHPKMREVLKGKEVQEKDTERLNDIYSACSHDIFADQLCKWTGLFATAFQQISYDERYKRIKKHNLQPQDVYVIPDKSAPDDLQHPNCFVAVRQDLNWMTKQTPDTDVIWQCWWGRYWWYETVECVPFKNLDLTETGVNENPYWTRDELSGEQIPVKPIMYTHSKLSGHIHEQGSDALVQQNQVFDRGMFKNLDLTETGVNENPYWTRDELSGEQIPVKPIMYTHSKLSGHIHEQGSDALVQQNQVFDRGMTGVTHTQEFQGFAIPVFSGVEPEEVADQAYSVAAPMHFRDPQAKLEFAHPAAPISEAQGAVIKGMRTTARLHQIDPELVDPETKVQSGISRAQGRVALAEKRTVEYPKWIPYERESYWLVAIIWNYHNESVPLTSIPRFDSPLISREEKVTILVQFGELAPNVDPMADAATQKILLDMDVVDRADIVAAQRQIPKDRAQEIVDANRDRNTKESRTMMSMKTPRTGQSGNPPMNLDRPDNKTGDNTTAASGNKSIKV